MPENIYQDLLEVLSKHTKISDIEALTPDQKALLGRIVATPKLRQAGVSGMIWDNIIAKVEQMLESSLDEILPSENLRIADEVFAGIKPDARFIPTKDAREEVFVPTNSGVGGEPWVYENALIRGDAETEAMFRREWTDDEKAAARAYIDSIPKRAPAGTFAGYGFDVLRDREPMKHALAQLMGDLSEAMTCASWCMGIEWSIWAAVVGDAPYERHQIQEPVLAMLRLMSTALGGWIVWRNTEGDERWAQKRHCYLDGAPSAFAHAAFVPMAQWLKEYEEEKTQYVRPPVDTAALMREGGGS